MSCTTTSEPASAAVLLRSPSPSGTPTRSATRSSATTTTRHATSSTLAAVSASTISEPTPTPLAPATPLNAAPATSPDPATPAPRSSWPSTLQHANPIVKACGKLAIGALTIWGISIGYRSYQLQKWTARNDALQSCAEQDATSAYCTGLLAEGVVPAPAAAAKRSLDRDVWPAWVAAVVVLSVGAAMLAAALYLQRHSRCGGRTDAEYIFHDAGREPELQVQPGTPPSANDGLRRRKPYDSLQREYEEKLSALDGDHQAAVKYLRGTEEMFVKLKQELQRVKAENGDLREQLRKARDEAGGSGAKLTQ